MEPGSTIIIPFDQCVLIICLLNRAYFSRRLSEISQTLDPISGI
jgi:hypothetical protein